MVLDDAVAAVVAVVVVFVAAAFVVVATVAVVVAHDVAVVVLAVAVVAAAGVVFALVVVAVVFVVVVHPRPYPRAGSIVCQFVLSDPTVRLRPCHLILRRIARAVQRNFPLQSCMLFPVLPL